MAKEVTSPCRAESITNIDQDQHAMVRDIFESFTDSNTLRFQEASALWRLSARSRKERGLPAHVADVPELDEALWEGLVLL